MSDSDTALYALAALICSGVVAYGLWTYVTTPNAGLVDVLPALFAVVLGTVAAARALGVFRTG